MNYITKTAFINVGTTNITNKLFPLNERGGGQTAAVVTSITLSVFTGLAFYFATSLPTTAIAIFTVMTINILMGARPTHTPKPLEYTHPFISQNPTESLGPGVYKLILDFAMPAKGSSEEVVSNTLNQFSFTCKQLANSGKKHIDQLRKLQLQKKYTAYPSDKNSELYDALQTGLKIPYSHSSFDSYTRSTTKDIIDIVRLIPESINTKPKTGNLRCRKEIPTFFIACHNSHVPLEVIEYLLEHGANPRDTINVNGYDTPILKDLEECTPGDRLTKIIKLIETHEKRELPKTPA